MTEDELKKPPKNLKITSRDTIAALTSEDMQRVFAYISVDDLAALEKMIVSGRAFHLPKGLEVYVLADESETSSTVKLRIKGSMTEFWGSISALT